MNSSNTHYQITDDHIGIFDNFYDDNLIEKYINYFELYSKNFKTHYRNNALKVKDESVCLMTQNYFEPLDLNLNYLTADFIDIFFQKIYPIYVQKYQILNDITQSIFDIKMQKTKPGEGYHIWHCENDYSGARSRICAFMLYLNDVNEGGETEFLHQKMRISPQKNRLVIWPSYFTHPHRGNPPISGEKYILTGWVEHS